MRILPVLVWIALLLSGCSTLKFWDDKPPEGDSPDQKTVKSDVEPLKLGEFDETVKVKKLWRVSTGKGQKPFMATLQPALHAEHVVTVDPEGVVSKFSIADGDRVWRAELDAQISGGVGIGVDLILLGSQDGEVIALAADTGELRWRVQLTSEILAPASADENIVVAQTQDGKLHGLSVLTGEPVWRYAAELPVLTLRGTSTPGLTENTVVAGFANGNIVALNPQSGTLHWETRLNSAEGSSELERITDINSPVLVGDIVYVSSYQGKVGALSRGIGRELWSQPSSSYRALAHGSESLFVVDAEDKIISYQASSGSQRWQNEKFLRRKLTQPVVVGSYVAVADREGYLHVLAFDNGRTVGRIKVDGDGVSVPMVANGETLFVLDNGGDLTAYKLTAR
jgi:outer membrane protein assembly factor BamB